jgi:PAS domain S-box-containing protein
MVHAVDTTAMVRARQEVEALAAERSAILGQIADVVITADPEGRVTFFNAAARTLYGEIRTGLPMWDDAQEFRLLDVDGERRRPEQTPIWRALQGERVFNDVWKIQRPDGTLVEVVGSAVPILHLKGQPIGAAMTVHDVTAERKLQRELAHERSRLHDLLMQAPASILVSEGPEHVLVLQNQFCRLLVGGRNVVGQRMADAFPEIVPQGFIALMDEVYRTGEPYEGRETYVDFDRNADGKLENGYFNFIYQPLRDADRRVYGILAFAVEVTDQVLARREVERRAEELAQLTRELERSNRDLDQFAYVASHDLKAPLRGIANLTEWIAEDLGERVSGESREHMHLLKGRVNRMEALIDGILQYSRAGRRMGKVETVESEKLVREVVELLSPEPDVTIEIAPDMPVLQAERTPLQQVFLNLIANAVKHGRPPVHVRISAQREGDRVRFGVQDNGPGIAPQFQERIWQIFQTLAPRDTTEGTGIGLSVVRKIVDAHGGRAWVESAEGQGATFYFTWPLVETRE